MRRQHNGKNNGNISIADGILGRLGWSHTSIAKGVNALVEHRLIVKTRQGGIDYMSKTPTLYGFTDLPVVPNTEKGIAAAQPDWSFRQFVAEPKVKHTRKKRSQGSCDEPIGTRGEPVHVHAVNGWPLIGTRGEP
jgi:hypothetical protein